MVCAATMSPTQAALPFRQSPAFPAALVLAAAPTVAVLQFRALAVVVLGGLLATVIAHWRLHRRLPVPGGMALAAAVALGLLAAVSAAWAADAGRALGTGLRFAGFVALGGAAAVAVAAEPPARLRRLAMWMAVGLAVGIVLAAVDHLSGNMVRALVRGQRQAHPMLYFGLKSAVSVIAVMLPLVLALPFLPRAGRIALAVAGLATALILPAESAKIAAILGVLVLLVAPLLTAVMLPRLPGIERLPPSAAHRVMIWDFVEDRIAERPLLGWGAESSRSVPGGRDMFPREALDRYGLTSEAWRAWFDRPAVERLPLHPHNAPLHLWLELGLAGAAVAAWLAFALGLAASRMRVSGAAAACLAATATVGMLSYGVWQEWWIGMQLLLVVAIAAIDSLARQSRAPEA
jgi:O-antigen ligase